MYYPEKTIVKKFRQPAMIRDTGIPVYEIIKKGIEGLEPEDILNEYQNLTFKDLDAVMRYGFSNAKEIEKDIINNTLKEN